MLFYGSALPLVFSLLNRHIIYLLLLGLSLFQGVISQLERAVETKA